MPGWAFYTASLDAMENLNKIVYISERDIDLLLLEEINVSADFSNWLYQESRGHPTAKARCVGAWHSVTHPQLGESDLVVRYEDDSVILIENKIDAPARPEQAARYKMRGEQGIEESLWSDFVTTIIAPKRYLENNLEAQSYDSHISYEKVRNWFKDEKSKRAIYRAQILDEAIEQNRRGYSPVADDRVTLFWLSYWELARDQFSALEMTQPGIKPANSDWPDFRPNALGGELNIVHKMAQGNVDLQVRGAAEKLDQIREFIDDPTLEVVATGKSGSVRMVTTPVDRFGSFEAQRNEIIRALELAEKLLQIGKEIRSGL